MRKLKKYYFANWVKQPDLLFLGSFCWKKLVESGARERETSVTCGFVASEQRRATSRDFLILLAHAFAYFCKIVVGLIDIAGTFQNSQS